MCVLGDVYVCVYIHKIRLPHQITYSSSLLYPAMFGWKLTLILDKEKNI